MKVSNEYIWEHPYILIAPILINAIQISLCIFTITTVLFLLSIGPLTPRSGLIFLTQVQRPEEYLYLALGFLAGFMWCYTFTNDLIQFLVASHCVSWYFTGNIEQDGEGSLLTGLWWAMRYHIGSICLGSLIMVPMQFIQFIFQFYYNFMRMIQKDNPLAKCVHCT